MGLLSRNASKKAGLPPGTLVHVGEKKMEKAKISVIDYDTETVEEKDDVAPEDCTRYRDSDTITWLNITGLHDTALVEQLGNFFDIHPLVLEDIVHTEQRPKLEDLGEYLFLTLKMMDCGKEAAGVRSDQISLIIGPRWVLSFQEAEADVFEPVRQRIRNAKGRIRRMDSSYLAYALVDAAVDRYFGILEKMGEDIESLQEEVLSNPAPETLEAIHRAKRDLILLRKSVWPLREAVSNLERGESPLIKETVRIYLRDIYDHTMQVIDSVETFREMVSATLDVYLSSTSNKMNQVMKVLTIIATIFIPLTFVAGIYGMNFKYMPELEWRWGYLTIWLIMIVIGLLMVLGFRRKKWL